MRTIPAVLAGAFVALLTAPAAHAGIWTPVDSGTGETIRALEYQSESRLWFVTEQGKVFRRLPSGAFAQATMGGGSSGVLFRDIDASPDGTTVIAVGDATGPSTPNVWRSMDGGATFARVSLPPVFRTPCGFDHTTGAFGNAYSVEFASPTVVYITGQYVNILKSTNGGAGFAEVNRTGAGNCKADSQVGAEDGSFADSAWADGSTGVFLGRSFGRLWRTGDGLAANSVRIRDTTNVYGQLPRIAIDRANPGRQWVVDRDFDAVSATDDGWGTLHDGTNGGLRYRNEGGRRFDEPWDVAFAGGTVVIAGSGGQIATSVDGRDFHYQRAEGALAARDWRATDAYDGAHAAVGGSDGALVLTAAGNTVPSEPGSAPAPGSTPPPGPGAGPAPGDGAGGATPDTNAPLLDFRGFGAATDGRSVTVTVGCGAGEPDGCRVALALVSRKKLKTSRRAKAKRLRLGAKTYTLRAGQRLRLRVPLSRLGTRMLRKHKRLSVRADLSIADAAGNAVKTAQTIALKAPKKKRR